MENKELKAALAHVIGIINRNYSQFNRYISGRFHLFIPTLHPGQRVYLGHHGEGWFVYLVYLQGVSLELHTKVQGDGLELYAKENSIYLTDYFEPPLNPRDEELELFKFLFPRDYDFIVAAGKEILKIEDKPNE